MTTEKVHPTPCPVDQCDASVPRLSCSAVNSTTNQPCTLSFCEHCVETLYGETRESIKSKDRIYVTSKGSIIRHQHKPPLHWACPVCRDICVCKFCNDKTSDLPSSLSVSLSKISLTPDISRPNRLTFGQKSTPINPPELVPVTLLHSEEEIWVRLQIREFIYRFDEICAIEPRILATLQNVQCDWRVKRLAATLVWHCLLIISTSYYETGATSNKTIPKNIGLDHLAGGSHYAPHMAARIIEVWIEEEGLDDPMIHREERDAAFKMILQREGMSAKRWQDVGEMLAAAGFGDLPVPTFRDSKASTEDEWQEVSKVIQRFRRLKRQASPLTSLDELGMVQRLLEMLLFDVKVREQLNDSSKGLKEKELVLKNERKTYQQEDSRNKVKKNGLLSRVSQLRAVGKDTMRLEAEGELEQLEVTIRDSRADMEAKELAFMIAKQRAEKRLQCAGTDNTGNTYWLFSDLLAPPMERVGHSYGNSEAWWAHGVVVVGPGFTGGTEIAWWRLEGIENMVQLEKYLQQEMDGAHRKGEYAVEVSNLTKRLYNRTQYLRTMEWCVFGEGYFR
ncbi:hypothetical protein J3Q64DRAFT_1728778 [Phycomyces blakesleeanus]